MLGIGVDVGGETVKIVMLDEDKKIIKRAIFTTGFDPKDKIRETIDSFLRQAGKTKEDARIVSTGRGRHSVDADDTIPEIPAVGKGVFFLMPTARTIVDMGGEDVRAVKLDATGKMVDVATSDKCAAGSGGFVATMARALEVSVPEFIELSLKASRVIPMNAQCVIFAESEVVSLIHAGVSKEDIARAIHHAMSERIAGVLNRVEVEEVVTLCGGVAKNVGLLPELKKQIKFEPVIFPETDYGAAIGAALVAFG